MNAPAARTASRSSVPARNNRPPAAATAPSTPTVLGQATQPAATDLDNQKFEAKARELLAATDLRPAVVVAAEVEAIRRSNRSGAGRFEALRNLAITRLAYVDERQGVGPRMTLSAFQRHEAEQFFETHGAGFGIKQAAAPALPAKPAAPAVESKPAPSPAPSTAAPDFRAIMAELKALRAEIAGLKALVAERPAEAAGVGGEAMTDFLMDSIKVGADETSGEKTYKAQGPSYKKFGVRIWPEVLPDLGVNADGLKFGENKLPKPLKVRALLVDGKPKKVIGLAS